MASASSSRHYLAKICHLGSPWWRPVKATVNLVGQTWQRLMLKIGLTTSLRFCSEAYLTKFVRSECITDRKSSLFLIVTVFSEKAAVARSTCLWFLNVALRCELSPWILTFREEFTAVLQQKAEVPDLIFSDPHANRFSHSCIVTSPYNKAGGTLSDIIHWTPCPITKSQTPPLNSGKAHH